MVPLKLLAAVFIHVEACQAYTFNNWSGSISWQNDKHDSRAKSAKVCWTLWTWHDLASPIRNQCCAVNCCTSWNRIWCESIYSRGGRKTWVFVSTVNAFMQRFGMLNRLDTGHKFVPLWHPIYGSTLLESTQDTNTHFFWTQASEKIANHTAFDEKNQHYLWTDPLETCDICIIEMDPVHNIQ